MVGGVSWDRRTAPGTVFFWIKTRSAITKAKGCVNRHPGTAGPWQGPQAAGGAGFSPPRIQGEVGGALAYLDPA